MNMRTTLFVNVVVICFVQSSAMWHCDMSTTARVQEGNLGQTSDFNWLGVLRVHLHDGDSLQVAVSGIVLIHTKYAMAHADDVVRIPERVFRTDTQAMFLVGVGTPWYVLPKTYVTHPEYEYSTLNSIAIVELDVDNLDRYPLNPICMPSVSYNTSGHLYIVGYTDENKLLEKVLYKIQYLPKQACEGFYNRAGLSDKHRMPTSYICGFAPYNSTHCVWDNGMPLVSNASGWFTLIGFGVRGPGCAAPARFIDLQPYYPWMNSVMELDQVYGDSLDARRQDSIEFIPTHELFKLNGTRRRIDGDDDDGDGKPDYMKYYEPYPFDTMSPRYFNIQPVEGDVIAIYPFDQTLELYSKSCKAAKQLLYKENFQLTAEGKAGSAVYKISLYDLISKICTCVELSIDCTKRDEAVLSFKEEFDFNLGTALGESSETPEHLFRYFPIYEPTPKPQPGDKWKPGINLVPTFIKSRIRSGFVLNYDLYIKFEFKDSANMTFAMYTTPPAAAQRSTTTPFFMPTTTTTKARKLLRKQQKIWGLRVNKRVKEPIQPLVVEHEVVQQTVSRACHNNMSFTIYFILELSILILFS